MFGRKKNEDDNEKRLPQKKNPKNDSLMDQLRDEMSSSFDDMQGALDEHLAGQSHDRRGGSKPPESVDYPWSSELDVDAEVSGTPAAPKASRTILGPKAPGDRRSIELPPNWAEVSPINRMYYLDRLMAKGDVKSEDILHLYPDWTSIRPGGAEGAPGTTPRKTGLLSRASRSRKKEDRGYLEGKDYQKHHDSFKAYANGEKDKFDPSTEGAFNTDARNLREYDTKIKAARGADTSEVRNAKEKKEQLIRAYRDVGRRRKKEHNYPRSGHKNFKDCKEMKELQKAYSEGHDAGEKSLYDQAKDYIFGE